MSMPFARAAWRAAFAGYPEALTQYEYNPFDGQSLSLGENGTVISRNAMNRLDRLGLFMLGGLKRVDGLPIMVAGPQGATYDTSVPATGLVRAATNSVMPTGLYVAAALRRRRAALSLPNPALIFGLHGIGGQSIAEFDDNQPTQTGSASRLIHDNRGFWMEQLADVMAGRNWGARYAGMIQGEADSNAASGTYYAQAVESFGDWIAQIARITGHLPTPCATQIGGYVRSDPGNKNYNVCIEQVRVMEDIGGIVLPPWYPIITADNNIHPADGGYREQADLISYHLTEREQGRPIPPFKPTSLLIGNQLVLTYPVRAGERLAFDGSGKYANYGGVVNQGFEVTGATITGVTLGPDHRSVVITCDAPPTGWSYAMQMGDLTAQADAEGRNYGTHRGLLRKEGPVIPTISTPEGGKLWQWALSWRGAM